LLLLDPGFLLFDRGPIADKVDYILTNVYPADRCQQNWLAYEFKYRQVLNEQIKFVHTDFSSGWENRPGQFDSAKNYFLYPNDPMVTSRLYSRFVSVNQTTYIPMISYERSQAEQYLLTRPGILLDTEDLYTEELSKEFYYKICEFGNLENQYSSAKTIHAAWYAAHNRNINTKIIPGPLYWPYVLTSYT
jgi:hypothetical protein